MKIFALIDYFCVFYFYYPIFVSFIKQDAKKETYEKKYYFWRSYLTEFMKIKIDLFFHRLIPLTNKYNSTMETVSGIVGDSGSSGNVSQANLMQRTVTYKSSSEETNNKAMALLQKAERVLSNSTSTEKEALELEEEVKDALNRTQGENKI